MKGYPLYDLDNHFYETEDVWTRHLEPEFREAFAEKPLLTGTGPLSNLSSSRAGWVYRPGSLREVRLAESRGPEAMQEYLVPRHPAFTDRNARIDMMDEQGLQACIMFSSAVSIEHKFQDPRELYAHFRALNRWIEDEWGYAFRDRIFTPPMLSLRDLDSAVDELDRVLNLGARVVNLRAGHAYGRSPGDPYLDPFWARLNEAGVPVTFHQGESGWNQAIAADWGQRPDVSATQQSAWQWMNTYGNAPIMAVLSALIYDNLFERFPNLRVASVENGAAWLPYFMKQIDKNRGIARNGPWIGGPLKERPTAIARRHILVSPYPEEDVESIVAAVGGVEMIALGSDYPHMEGCASPADFAERLTSLDPADQRRILSDNVRVFLGLGA